MLVKSSQSKFCWANWNWILIFFLVVLVDSNHSFFFESAILSMDWLSPMVRPSFFIFFHGKPHFFMFFHDNIAIFYGKTTIFPWCNRPELGGAWQRSNAWRRRRRPRWRRARRPRLGTEISGSESTIVIMMIHGHLISAASGKVKTKGLLIHNVMLMKNGMLIEMIIMRMIRDRRMIIIIQMNDQKSEYWN